MKTFEECINILGCSPTDDRISQWLNSLDISERPVYEDAPVKWLSHTNTGLTFMFEGRVGYEETYGNSKAKSTDTMVLKGLRFYGPMNSDSFKGYKGKLLFNLDFQCDLKKFKDKLGKEDREGGISKKILVWKDIQALEVSIVLTKDQGNIEYIDISPSRK